MGESILVVGGAGYIGSHTAKLLRHRGYTPVVLDDLSTGHRAAMRFGPFVEGSFHDAALVERILREHRVAAVMHFGAKALVEESVRDPLLYYSSNVAGTVRLLEAMRRAGVRTFVFSSTCATFGEPDTARIPESAAQKPVNPYGRSKLFVETILRDLDAASGLRSAVLRYFNAAGCDPEGELGEDHRPETHLIPRAVRVALGRVEKLVVNGTDYSTADGSCIRDYVHVNDLAEAHIAAMELVRSLDRSFDFNLGSGRGHSVLEVLSAIGRAAGRELRFEVGPRRAGDPPRLVADPSRAAEMLGWGCKIDLDSIIRTTMDWEKRHPEGYAAG